MPKPMYVWTGTAWVSVASEVESLATYATQSYADSQPGSKLIIPSSIAVGSGSGSVSTQGAVTFTNASSISLNDVFSTNYDNYKLMINISSSNTTGNLFMRLRVSGSDNTNNEYTRNKFYVDQTNAYGSDSGSAGTSSFYLGSVAGTNNAFAVVELGSPFLSQRTKHFTLHQNNLNIFMNGGSSTVTTSYTGFTLFHDVTSFSGTIRVYGYKNG